MSSKQGRDLWRGTLCRALGIRESVLVGLAVPASQFEVFLPGNYYSTAMADPAMFLRYELALKW